MLCGVWAAAGKQAWQDGQASRRASTTRSGVSVRTRATPGRPPRGGLSPDGRFGLWPRAGGVEELSGVLGGRVSSSMRASKAATRASAASSCPTNGSNERISTSFSASVIAARSIAGRTPALNRITRDRVNPCLQTHRRSARYAQADTQGEQLLPEGCMLGCLWQEASVARVRWRSCQYGSCWRPTSSRRQTTRG